MEKRTQASAIVMDQVACLVFVYKNRRPFRSMFLFRSVYFKHMSSEMYGRALVVCQRAILRAHSETALSDEADGTQRSVAGEPPEGNHRQHEYYKKHTHGVRLKNINFEMMKATKRRTSALSPQIESAFQPTQKADQVPLELHHSFAYRDKTCVRV